MRTEIFYFSGTGNCLFLAKELASKLDAALTPVASAVGRQSIETDADTVGIVFPVYYGELPVIIKAFAGKLSNIGGKYVFAICTYGGGKSQSMKILRRILQSRGGELSAEYGIHMPQNAFLKSWENNGRIIARGGRKMDIVARNTKDRKRGSFFRNIPLELMLSPMHTLFKPLYVKKFVQMTNAPTDTPFDEMIALSDRNFSVNASCNVCGTCARVCPVGNIEIAGGKPVWLHRCENCLACYDWCPKRAIEGGVAQKGYYYRNPEVTVAEFFSDPAGRENVKS